MTELTDGWSGLLRRSTLSEECGVFGVWGHPDAGLLTHYGLYALQHRGQESAGIAVRVDEQDLRLRSGMGLVSEVFDPEDMKNLGGRAAVGHVRYSTTGEPSMRNAQPLCVRLQSTLWALAHNGNLVNAGSLRSRLEEEGSIFQTTSDTEVIAHLAARVGSGTARHRLETALGQIRGGYALVVLTPDELMCVRDPHGIRPLCLGRLDGGWVAASESCALDTVGAEFVREVEPGEIVHIDDSGMTSSFLGQRPSRRAGLCIFEYIYFARPDSNLAGLNVHQVRKQMGRYLAVDSSVQADVVSGVPDSSLSAASGYAEQAQIPYEMGLVRNRYVGRTFIQPQDSLRQLGVKLKFNPLRKVVQDRSVVLVDDSIVRGTTCRTLIGLLRTAGAGEIHIRISSPPYQYPCYYGIDTSRPGELIAADRSADEVRDLIGADSLSYLSVDRVAQAAGGDVADFCTACFDGEYIVPPQGEHDA